MVSTIILVSGRIVQEDRVDRGSVEKTGPPNGQNRQGGADRLTNPAKYDRLADVGLGGFILDRPYLSGFPDRAPLSPLYPRFPIQLDGPFTHYRYCMVWIMQDWVGLERTGADQTALDW